MRVPDGRLRLSSLGLLTRWHLGVVTIAAIAVAST